MVLDSSEIGNGMFTKLRIVDRPVKSMNSEC